MDWTQLQAVVAVTRHRSFSGAAEELRLTQPGVSRQVQKLEQELGAVLFVRRRRGVTLTPAGERVYAYAAETLARREQLLRELRGAPADLAGELRIAASTTPGEFIVPGLVSGFRERFPRVQPRVVISDSATVVEDLQQERADVGFVGARLIGRELRYEAVAEDEVVLAVSAGHRFAARGEVALSDLAGERFVEREGGSGTLLSVRRAVASCGLQLPRYEVVMVLSTTQAIISAVEHGYGIGWVSSLALADRGTVRVRAVRVAGLTLRRELFMVTPEDRQPSPVAAGFVDWVQQAERSTRPPTPR